MTGSQGSSSRAARRCSSTTASTPTRSTGSTSAGVTRPCPTRSGFAHRVRAERVLLFHHDPMHTDDFLDALHGEIETAWEALGGAGAGVQIELAAERSEIVLGGHTAPIVPDAAAEGAALRAGASRAAS